MKLTLLILIAALVVSIALNVFLYFKAKSLKNKPKDSYAVTELLHDLTRGSALVEIRRINPESVLLRSPRA